MKYVGFMKSSFKDRNSGREVEFAKIYVTYEKAGVVGQKAEELKCSVALVPDLEKLELGTEIELMYDRYGRAQNVVVEGDI